MQIPERRPAAKRGRLVRTALVAAVLLIVAGGVLAHGWYRGWFVAQLTPAELGRLLEPSYEVLRPVGEGPFPAVVQFHACAGVSENQRTWARRFQRAGWVSLVVDSLGPRGLDWKPVCNGTSFLGSERAGDVAVALAYARELPIVDRDRIVLAGWSHGAWAIADLLAMDPPRELPHNLTEMPAGGLSGLAGLLFVYPYCGFGTRSEPWQLEAPALFLLAGGDQVADPDECLELTADLKAAGRDVRVVTFEGVRHSFDEPVHTDGTSRNHDPEATARAHRIALEFLEQLSGGRSE